MTRGARSAIAAAVAVVLCAGGVHPLPAQGSYRAGSGAARATLTGPATLEVTLEEPPTPCDLVIALGGAAEGEAAHGITLQRNANRCTRGREFVVDGGRTGAGPELLSPGVYQIAAGEDVPDRAWRAHVNVHGAGFTVVRGTLTITAASATTASGSFALQTEGEDDEGRILRARFTGTFSAVRPPDSR